MELNISYLPDLDIDTAKSTFTSLDVHKSVERKLQPGNVFALGLRSFLDSNSSFPAYSLVIGVCNDGSPFALSLDNPKTGSILIVGDDFDEIIQLLKVMSLSTCLLNDPRDVKLLVISGHLNKFAELHGFPHCEEILAPDEQKAGEVVIELASIASQRIFGKYSGSRIVLIIDDLSSCRNLISDDYVYFNLKSLIKRGPNSGIWPIISMPSHTVNDTNRQLLHSFGTYIFNKPAQASPTRLFLGQGMAPNNIKSANFDVIIGGRLIPVANLSIDAH